MEARDRVRLDLERFLARSYEGGLVLDIDGEPLSLHRGRARARHVALFLMPGVLPRGGRHVAIE